MFSIKSLFRNGPGPSSIYSIHPHRIAKEFKDECHNTTTIKVTLYGTFKDNYKENFTEKALKSAISPCLARIVIADDCEMNKNITAAKFEAFGKNKIKLKESIYYFNKLGEISELENDILQKNTIEDIINWTYENGRTIWEYAINLDRGNLEDYMALKWKLMKKSIKKGLNTEGGLPGIETEQKRASLFFSRSIKNRDFIQNISKTMSYALAAIEESASANEVVAAPTAKSCGIIPGVLYSLKETYKVSEIRIIRGLITAGIIGKLLHKHILDENIFSEILIATAMASAAATQILGGSPKQVIASAAISLNDLKHEQEKTDFSHLNYIELNALAASNALNNASWALLSDKNISKEIDFFYTLTMDNRATITI